MLLADGINLLHKDQIYYFFHYQFGIGFRNKSGSEKPGKIGIL